MSNKDQFILLICKQHFIMKSTLFIRREQSLTECIELVTDLLVLFVCADPAIDGTQPLVLLLKDEGPATNPQIEQLVKNSACKNTGRNIACIKICLETIIIKVHRKIFQGFKIDRGPRVKIPPKQNFHCYPLQTFQIKRKVAKLDYTFKFYFARCIFSFQYI